MAAKINRTGKTYGDLTVLETILGSNSKKDTYLVKCNCCGNTMIIGIDALLKGLKCKNCRNKDRKSTYQDLIGKECNGIKVVSLAEDAIGRTGHRDIRYNCLCSCGKEFVAYRSSLLQGKVKSCGCRKHITEASKMLVDNAEAMQDYDFAKNKDIDVSMLTQGSNVIVWWKCSACGTEWQTSVYHYIQRIKPCPVCSTIDKGRTSFQEQAVAYYAKKYFPKVVIGDKKAIGKELDIYIPSIRAAIEYDGVRYHSDEKRVKNDEEKSEKCKRNGIRLIRIREYGLPEIRNSENIIRENNRGHATLDAAIRQCLEMLGVSEPNIDTQKDSKDIYRQYKATILSKREIGADTINFYNYFARYCLSPEEPLLKLLNCADNEAIEIISGQPLVKQFCWDSSSSCTDALTQRNQATAKEALTYTRNLTQQAFSELDAVFSEFHDTKGPDGSKVVFMPKQVITTFALLNNKIVQVYSVKDLYDYLSIDFYYANYASESAKRIAICPCCKRAFRLSQRNKVYCSKACKDKSIRVNNKKDPYYSKYRYLQQYNNRQLNKLRKQMADSPQQTQKLQDAYNTWNEWARSEYERVSNITYHEQQESIEKFGECLKEKWKGLMREAK